MKRILAILFLSLTGCSEEQSLVTPVEADLDETGGFEYITIEGRRYYYTDSGSGPTIILNHGASFCTKDAYKYQVEPLVKSGFRVVVPFRAGSFISDPRPTYNMGNEVSDLIDLMDHLEIEKAALLGHSGGSGFIQQFYLRHPERVTGMISIDSGSYGKFYYSEFEQIPIDRYSDEVMEAYIRNIDELRSLGKEFDFPSDFNLAQLRFKAACEETVGNPADEITTDTWLPADDNFCGTTPTLVFVGGRGKVGPDDPEALALKERLRCQNAELVVIKDTGHYPHKEHAEEFNEKLISFLRSLE